MFGHLVLATKIKLSGLNYFGWKKSNVQLLFQALKPCHLTNETNATTFQSLYMAPIIKIVDGHGLSNKAHPECLTMQRRQRCT